jgi:hypothetical protein
MRLLPSPRSLGEHQRLADKRERHDHVRQEPTTHAWPGVDPREDEVNATSLDARPSPILHGVPYHAACLDARRRIVGEDE